MSKMRISARNQIKGVVKKIEKGEVASVVKIEIAEPAIAILTSMLTKEAVEDLDLKEGDKVEAVIKATEILILKE
jgi:molybdate transport system regulatory protein